MGVKILGISARPQGAHREVDRMHLAHASQPYRGTWIEGAEILGVSQNNPGASSEGMKTRFWPPVPVVGHSSFTPPYSQRTSTSSEKGKTFSEFLAPAPVTTHFLRRGQQFSEFPHVGTSAVSSNRRILEAKPARLICLLQMRRANPVQSFPQGLLIAHASSSVLMGDAPACTAGSALAGGQRLSEFPAAASRPASILVKPGARDLAREGRQRFSEFLTA
jgi:hypothetical protein